MSAPSVVVKLKVDDQISDKLAWLEEALAAIGRRLDRRVRMRGHRRLYRARQLARRRRNR